jgi:hypothetical protein
VPVFSEMDGSVDGNRRVDKSYTRPSEYFNLDQKRMYPIKPYIINIIKKYLFRIQTN